MIGRNRLSKFTYVMVFSLIASLTFTPLMFPVVSYVPEKQPGLERESQAVRYKRIQDAQREKKQSERESKRQKHETQHAAVRRQIELVAPFWKIGEGFESTLVITNTFDREIDVTPVLYSNTGQQISARGISLKKLASETISLRDLAGSNGYGQIALRFHGEPLEIHASMVISNIAQSLSTSHPFEKRSYYSSSRLDGVFYVPSPSAKSRVALSNTSDASVEVVVAVRDEGSEVNTQRSNQPVVLGSHETRIVDLMPLLTRGWSNGQAVATTVIHSGAPGDVLVHGVITDSSGFSSNIRFLEPSSITELDLTSPIYERNTLRPLVLLNNTGDQDANVQLLASYVTDGQKRETSLFGKEVRKRSTAHIDLNSQLSLIPANATNLGLKIIDSGKRRGILADVLLLDASGSQVLQLFPKGFAGEVHPSHGFPFRIDTGMNTIITVANPSQTEDIDYSLHLFFDGKTYTYDDTTLKAGEIKHIDVRALRDRQIPGQHKALIPKNVISGQGKVHFRPKAGSAKEARVAPSEHSGHAGGPHGGHARVGGIAGATIIDEVRQMSFVTICEPTCPPEGEGVELWFDGVYAGGVEGVVGDTLYFDAGILFYDGSYIQANSVYWWGYDSNVAQPYQFEIDLVGAGYTEVSFQAYIDSWGWDCFECETNHGTGEYCPPEGYPITGYITGWADVYAYAYSATVTTVNVDAFGDGSLTVYTDGPYWLSPTLTVSTGGYQLYSGAAGVGGHQIALLEGQQYHLPAGSYVNADLVYGSATPSQAINVNVIAIPIHFHQTAGGVDGNTPGAISFNYAWDSSTMKGNDRRLGDLANCLVGEEVTYPAIPVFNWPFPPYGVNGGAAATNSPEVIINRNGTQGDIGDTHFPVLLPANMINQGAPEWTAVQSYVFQCTNYNNGNYEPFVNDLHFIKRTVTQNANGTWKYRIEKDNVVGGFNVIP